MGKEGPYAEAAPAPADASRNVPARTLWLDPAVVGASCYVVGMAATWLPPYLQLGLGNSQATTGWLVPAVFALQPSLLPAGAWLCQSMQRRAWRWDMPARRRWRLIVVICSGNSVAAFVSTYGTGWIVDAARPDMALGFSHAMTVACLVLLSGAFACLPSSTRTRLPPASAASPTDRGIHHPWPTPRNGSLPAKHLQGGPAFAPR